MTDLYLIVDGEANVFASLDDVQAFLKSSFQEGPALYQIMTDKKSPHTDAIVPYLRELDIPEDWKYDDPEAEGETA